MSRTPGEHKRVSVENTMKKYLKDDKIKFSIQSIDIKENFKENITYVAVDMTDNADSFVLEGESKKGAIHAFSKPLLEKYSKDYSSLNNIALVGFSVLPDFKKTKKGTDAVAEVLMEFKNKNNVIIPVRSIDRSYIRASFISLLSGVEFFINLEKSYFHILKCVEDANKRRRGDLSTKYKYDLAALVEINNFNAEH